MLLSAWQTFLLNILALQILPEFFNVSFFPTHPHLYTINCFALKKQQKLKCVTIFYL